MKNNNSKFNLLQMKEYFTESHWRKLPFSWAGALQCSDSEQLKRLLQFILSGNGRILPPDRYRLFSIIIFILNIFFYYRINNSCETFYD